MSVAESEHKVYIYTNDYNALCTEVYRHQHIETGGNLFGLWTTSGSAVIHVLLGPGKNCRRTDTSFHQDIEYLKRVGRFVNQQYMLCHIGEWHSHHCLSLSKPSRGDELTIERNFPRGMTKFLVIIANIKDRDQILLSPYFFTHDGTRYEKAKFEVLETDSPFSCDDKIMKEIDLGSEREKTNLSEIANHVATASNDAKNLLNMGSNPQRDGITGHTHSQATQTNNHPSGDDVIPMETSDYEPFVSRPLSSTGNTSSQISTSQLAESAAGENFAVNSEDSQALKKDAILKEINDVLNNAFSKNGEVHIERNTTSEHIEMRFEHHLYHWMIRFPDSFPNQPAQLYKSLFDSNLSHIEPISDYNLEIPLTNHVNILLSITKNCCQSCNACTDFKKENFAKSVSATIPRNPNLEDVVKGLENEIKLTLATLFKYDGKAKNGGYRIEFEHDFKKWYIDLPAEFPDEPAQVCVGTFRGGANQFRVVQLFSNTKHERQPLNATTRIITAIKVNCRCFECSKPM